MTANNSDKATSLSEVKKMMTRRDKDQRHRASKITRAKLASFARDVGACSMVVDQPMGDWTAKDPYRELYSVVVPMGTGKTTMRDKYGFVDFDDISRDQWGTPVYEMLGELMYDRGTFNHAMAGARQRARRVLNMMSFEDPVILMVNDFQTAKELDAPVMCSVYLLDEAFKASMSGKPKAYQKLADMNRKMVMECPGSMSALNISDVQAVVMSACYFNDMPSAAAFEYHTMEKMIEYRTENIDIIRGKVRDAKVVKSEFDAGNVPVEAVHHVVNTTGKTGWEGFGLTNGEWARRISQIVSGSKEDFNFQGYLDKHLHLSEISMDDQLDMIRESHYGNVQMGEALANHWLEHSDEVVMKELVYRLYHSPGDVMCWVLNEVNNMMSKYNYIGSSYIGDADKKVLLSLAEVSPFKAAELEETLRDMRSVSGVARQEDAVKAGMMKYEVGVVQTGEGYSWGNDYADEMVAVNRDLTEWNGRLLMESEVGENKTQFEDIVYDDTDALFVYKKWKHAMRIVSRWAGVTGKLWRPEDEETIIKVQQRIRILAAYGKVAHAGIKRGRFFNDKGTDRRERRRAKGQRHGDKIICQYEQNVAQPPIKPGEMTLKVWETHTRITAQAHPCELCSPSGVMAGNGVDQPTISKVVYMRRRTRETGKHTLHQNT